MTPAVALYRHILKLVKLLPPASHGYYRAYAKENFVTFGDEVDPVRVRELVERGKEHARWVLKKYKVEEPPGAL